MRRWTPFVSGTRTLVGGSATPWGCVNEVALGYEVLRLAHACRQAATTCNSFTYWASLCYLTGWARARVWLREELAGAWGRFRR